MSLQPDDLLGDAPLEAAVQSLLERNAHHWAAMGEQERGEAVATWRDLARTVLTAAAAAAGRPPEGAAPEDAGGRAVIVIEDDAEEGQVAVHASFYPRLEQLAGGEVLATPAQATALELLDGLGMEDEDEDAAG